MRDRRGRILRRLRNFLLVESSGAVTAGVLDCVDGVAVAEAAATAAALLRSEEFEKGPIYACSVEDGDVGLWSSKMERRPK